METKQFRYQLINMQIFTYRPYSGITYNISNSLTSLLHNRFYFLDPFKQKWHSAVTESPKCFNYKLFITDHTYEHFFDILPPAYLQKNINFRMCNNYLPIEKLRWAGIDRDHRKCNSCDKRDIGEEFHYLLSCSFFANTSRGLLPPCYLQHPNCIVFKKVLNEKDELKLTNMQTYLCHTEAISKSTRQLIMCLCIFFLLFLISIH